MKIEILFPEICNLYGDLFNVKYLKACLQDAEVIKTGLKDKPFFASGAPDLIYMGSTTEKGQVLASEALSGFKERIGKLIDGGACFFVTGNALEVFGKEIREEGKKVCDGLGIVDIVSDRKKRQRFNSLYLGQFSHQTLKTPLKIVGFKSLFGFAYGDISDRFFLTTERGDGLNPQTGKEGIHINNFFATYVTGPFLVLNPPFTKWLLKEVLKIRIPKIAYEKAAFDAYESRVKEYSDLHTSIRY